jgi:hypothetical protein
LNLVSRDSDIVSRRGPREIDLRAAGGDGRQVGWGRGRSGV